MYLTNDIQKTLRELGKISDQEVVKKEGDLYLAVNVLTRESRILSTEQQLIEFLSAQNLNKNFKKILKG